MACSSNFKQITHNQNRTEQNRIEQPKKQAKDNDRNRIAQKGNMAQVEQTKPLAISEKKLDSFNMNYFF